MLLDDAQFAERLRRHRRFWGPKYAGEGAYISINAPRDDRVAAPPPRDLHQQWLDVDYRVQVIENALEGTWFGLDAVPVAMLDFGPGMLPALLGRPYELREQTIWYDQWPSADPESVFALQIRRDTEFYQAYRQLTQTLLERACGRYLVALADFGGSLDSLASLYERGALLEDILFEPERVSRQLAWLAGLLDELRRENLAQLRRYQDYIPAELPLVNDQDWFPVFSELSVMLSPQCFEQVSLPALTLESAALPRVFYGMDGDTYLRLLPCVLQVPRLHSIIWGPTHRLDSQGRKVIDYNQPHIYEFYQQALERIKVVIPDLSPEQAIRLMDNIPQDGVFLFVDCTSEDEAKSFAEHARSWVR
ncbi:MAG: hypothetical protein LBO07_02105 [Coriobacteriales bacterium]|jgi:hypothetical protein|nr:hypothetical protein [Coriobacteriales bacterium]